MYCATLAAVITVYVSVAQVSAQPESNPPVIAKMEELGTVYVTRAASKDAPKKDAKKGPIIGIDFRPMAGSDPKKVTAAVKELHTLPGLQTLLLLGRDVTDDAVEALPKSAKLKSIQFFNTSVTDSGVAKLSRFNNLQVFKYTGMNISDQAMKDLAKLKTLHTIEITDSKITDVGVLALQALPNLRELLIENTAATQQSIDQLRERLPRITGTRSLR